MLNHMKSYLYYKLYFSTLKGNVGFFYKDKKFYIVVERFGNEKATLSINVDSNLMKRVLYRLDKIFNPKFSSGIID